MAMINVTIDGIQVAVEEGTTILAAAKAAGIEIPTLCYLKDVNEIGACRVCVVEVEGATQLSAACNTVATDGMVVKTNSPKAVAARRANVQLLVAAHDVQCTTCVRSGNCQLQKLANDLGLPMEEYEKCPVEQAWPSDSPLIRDASRCVKCGRCVSVCEKIQHVGVWEYSDSHLIDVAGGVSIKDSLCTLCGQCITHCPTGALTERDDTARVRRAINDPETITVVQVAPAVRAAWAEEAGIPREEATPERMAAALRRLGFDYVFDTDWSADLTIMEEGSEFVERLKNAENETFPMFTSCCPGWVRFIKGHWPQYTNQLSTAKSPQQMFGAMVKSYFAKRIDADPNKIFSLSIMPCLAKKHECALENMNDAGAGQDVDMSLTVREFVRMMRAANIDIASLPEEKFDDIMGIGTGAGIIFGATGGVMEAALRSAYFLVTGENCDPDAFQEVRGQEGWREYTFNLAGTDLKIAVASGLENTNKLMTALDKGEVSYHFVEIMACPGGCAGGGGQPIHFNQELAEERGSHLYFLDKNADLRFSHENPEVVACYEQYLEAPLSHTAHHLLHSDHADWSMPHA